MDWVYGVPAQITVFVTDMGEPADEDTFAIIIPDENEQFLYENSGLIGGGKIQLFPVK